MLDGPPVIQHWQLSVHNVSVRMWGIDTERGHLQTLKQLYASVISKEGGCQFEIFDISKWLSGKLY